jgi:hypothetical protein
MKDDDIDSLTGAWIDIDAKSHRKAMSKTLERLQGRTDLGVRDQWAKDAVDQEDWQVVSLQAADYKLPSVCQDFLGQELITELKSIFATVETVNNELAGMRISHCEIILAGDDRIEQVGMRLFEWARKYVSGRIERSKHRREELVQKYDRIYRELLPDLEKIAFRKGSINRCFMAEFTDYLPWLLLERTCRDLIEIKFDPHSLVPSFRINSSDPNARTYLEQIVRIYQWQHDTDLLKVIEQFPASELNLAETDDTQLNNHLELLVANIREMRPFLVRNFKPENIIIEITKNVFISFSWAVGRGIGLIHVTPTREKMLALHNQKVSGVTFTLLFDGYIANYYSPWIKPDSLPEEKRKMALAANLHIVEAIHDALLSFYEKIDVAAVVARFSEKRKKTPELEPNDQEFAAICQLISEGANAGTGATLPRQFKAVRVQKLLNILTKQLGCEIRKGKGSEIVIFRADGHHFRLGHHKRNIYVPTLIIRSILKHVGITCDEWLSAITS